MGIGMGWNGGQAVKISVSGRRYVSEQTAVYLDNKKSDEWKGRSVLSRIIK